MTHLTDAILAAVVSGLPETFESHDVIRGLMTTYPQEYVRELYENVTAVDPIRTTGRSHRPHAAPRSGHRRRQPSR